MPPFLTRKHWTAEGCRDSHTGDKETGQGNSESLISRLSVSSVIPGSQPALTFMIGTHALLFCGTIVVLLFQYGTGSNLILPKLRN